MCASQGRSILRITRRIVLDKNTIDTLRTILSQRHNIERIEITDVYEYEVVG